MSDTPYLSVVIPAFNESHRIEVTLSESRRYLDGSGRSYEVIVVDDGSGDDTVARVQALAADWPALHVLRLPSNQGKGAAVRTGCLAASGERVLFMDADHSTRIEQLEAFLPYLDGAYEVVAGVRTFQEGESRSRRIIGLGFLMLAHLIVFRKAVVDSQCGFKCFTREAVQAIFPRTHINGGTIDVEILYYAHRLDLPVYFQPVEWRNAPGSTISPLRCLVQDPIDMIRIRLRDVFDKG
ncbi:MAG: glycosyltransferase family 2 protein [bacterium]|nr:glycosyltransferase family 2 protein [bacterium]